MRLALSDVGKASQIDGIRLVIHVILENEILLVFPCRSVLHMALVVVRGRSERERAAEVCRPSGVIRVHHDIRRREDDMLLATGNWRWKHTDVPQFVLSAGITSRNDSPVHGMRWTQGLRQRVNPLFAAR